MRDWCNVYNVIESALLPFKEISIDPPTVKSVVMSSIKNSLLDDGASYSVQVDKENRSVSVDIFEEPQIRSLNMNFKFS